MPPERIESPDPTAIDEPRPKRRLSQRGQVVLALLAILALAWGSGLPQGWLLRYYVQSHWGADCGYSSLRLFPTFELGSLKLSDPGALNQPLLMLEGLRVDYRLLHGPVDPPNQLAIKGLTLDFQSLGTGESNFDFLRDAIARASAGTGTAETPSFLPMQVGIDTVNFSMRRSETAFSVAGLRLNALLDRPDDFTATLQSELMRLHGRYGEVQIQGQGPLVCSVKRDGADVYWDWDVNLAGLLALKGSGLRRPSPEGVVWRGGIESMILEAIVGQDWLPAHAPFLRFDRLKMSDATGDLLCGANGYQFSQARLNVSVEKLCAGSTDAPAFSGNVSLAAEVQPGNAPSWKGALTLDTNQKIEFAFPSSLSPREGTLSVDAWTWAQFTAILPPPLRPSFESYDGIAALSMTLHGTWENEALSLSGKVRPRFRNEQIQEASIGFSAQCAPPNWQLWAGKSMTMDAGPMLRAGLGDWQLDAAAKTGQGQLTCFFDLMETAQRLYLPTMYGECNLSGPVQWQDSTLRFNPIEFKGEALGYKTLTLPYGLPLTLKGNGAVTLTSRAFEAGPVTGQLGDDTQINAARMAGEGFGGEDWQIRIEEATVQSRLEPLTALNWLRQTDATAEFNTKALAFGAGGTKGRIDLKVVAPKTHLRDEWAVFTDLRLDGFLEWAEAFGGQATMAAQEALALGGVVHDPHGTVRIKDDTVFFEQVQGTVFNGALNLDASIGSDGDARLIQTAGHLERVDLAVFTEEYKPSDIKLAGLASGTFDLKFRNGEIAGLTIHLETVEGCSLNRDAVQRILLSQYAQGIAGGKVVNAIESAIGEAPQCPFAQARVDLTLKGDKITGDAVLESGSIRLSIDITADPQTLQDAVLLRQMQRAEIAPAEGENPALDAGGSSALQ